MKPSPKMENFMRAFDTNGSGCRRQCACGREFWDGYNHWDWNEGEVEALEKDENATCLMHGIGTIHFQGVEYVMDCDCWFTKAERTMGFIDGHAKEIAKYLTLEKQRLQYLANEAPVVGD